MDNDKNNSNASQINITGDENMTLHNAGVDLPAEDEIVDIDQSGASADDLELKNMGLKFHQDDTPNKEDLFSLKEKMDKKNQSSDINQPKIEEQKSFNIQDIENQFKEVVGEDQVATPQAVSLNDKVSNLQRLLDKIKEKLGIKNDKVKEEIESLKSLKKDITQEIEQIKELEESKIKIESELKKVDGIKEEIESIEKEVNNELNY